MLTPRHQGATALIVQQEGLKPITGALGHSLGSSHTKDITCSLAKVSSVLIKSVSDGMCLRRVWLNRK